MPQLDPFFANPRSPTPPALDYSQRYPCPICRQGEIAALTLMEAMACQTCGHIYTIEPLTQHLQVADSAQPIQWSWTGKRWLLSQTASREVSFYTALLAVALVCFPTGIVAIGAYLFPPLPDDPLAWLPWAWVTLTFSSHFLLFLWGFLEYYQFPAYVSLKLRLQELLP